jgi:hypothetical protein
VPSFFSFRVAPGVRISASGRGVRAHLGPRAARLHVGGGGTGVSTGAGPFTHYQSLSRGSAGRRPTSGPSSAEQKAHEAQRIEAVLRAISTLHRAEFASPVEQTAPLPALPPFRALIEQAEAHHVRAASLFRRAERRAARSRARADAEIHARRILGEARAEQRQAQDALDESWRLLLINDEDTLLPALEAAFEDNQAPAAALGVDIDTVNIVVLVPGLDAVPDRLPSVTKAGNLSLKAMPKSTQAAVYRDVVAGHVLLSAQEALAVGVGLEAASVVAVRRESDGGLSALLATRIERNAVLHEGTPWAVLEHAVRDMTVNLRGISKTLSPLNLAKEPELRALVDECALD